MKNSADQGGCYPQRPKAEVDNTLPCFSVLKGVSPFRSLFFRSPKEHILLSSGFLGQQCNNLQQAALLTSLVQYLVNSSWLWLLCSWARHFTLTVPLSTKVY